MISKAIEIRRTAGVTGLASRAVALAYRRGVRPFLPDVGPVHYAGIPVAHSRKVGDGKIPSRWRPGNVEDVPDYESALVSAVRAHVRPGDHVVVVGGGVGVTATIAAVCAGSAGRVECFEGAIEGVGKVSQTARLNGVSERLVVHHAVVARSISVYGTEPSQGTVEPCDLPDCDVLELDCEGAEVDILQRMTIRPRAILVETHGIYGASSQLIGSLLEGMGYRAVDKGIAEPRLRQFCEENDVRVLVALSAE